MDIKQILNQVAGKLSEGVMDLGGRILFVGRTFK